MSKSTISTFQLFEMFPDAESARLFLESRIWSDGVTCPTCKASENITTRKRVGFFRASQSEPAPLRPSTSSPRVYSTLVGVIRARVHLILAE